MEKLKYKIEYTPNGSISYTDKKKISATKLMINELIGSRELIFRLFIRDFSAKYRQSFLGVIWALIIPIATVGTFVMMNKSGVLNMSTNNNIPYPLYALLGISIWNLFSVGITNTSNSLISAGSMVSKINFPKISLVISSSLQGFVGFIIQFIVVIFAFFWYQITPNPFGLLIGLFATIPLYLFMLGFGFILSLASGIVRDIPNIIGYFLTAFMLITPILYNIKEESSLSKFNLYNPLNYFVNVPRDLILNGKTELLNGYIISSVLALFIFYIGWRIFYFAQTKIAERI